MQVGELFVAAIRVILLFFYVHALVLHGLIRETGLNSGKGTP